MNEFSQVSSASVSQADRGRGLRYLMVGAAINALFWGLTLLLVRDAPQLYTSQCLLIFPGSGTKTSPSSGSARGESSRNQQDTKASYAAIAATDEVRKAAAAKLSMTAEQFGQPEVQLSAGTALMTIAMTATTSQEAQKKVYALEEALQERLTQLRVQQVSEQESGFDDSIKVARKKLEVAQFRLSDYRIRSGLASTEQINQLASNIETLRRLRAEVVAQQQDTSVRARQLSSNLGTSAPGAADAFTLRSDSLFQQYEREYSEATATLTTLSAKFGPNHPVIVRETARQKAAEAALQVRGQTLLGQAINPTTIAQLSLGNGEQTATGREALFKDVVTNQAEQQGLAARIQELDRQLFQLEQRLSVLAQRNSTLDALNRDMQVAESIFSSKLSTLDASGTDMFAAYPPVQMAAEPNLPSQSTIPHQKPLFIGAAISSLVVTTMLLTLWLRKVPSMKRWLPW